MIGSSDCNLEIQQNSDVTYRVYDYGRTREIHVEKALAVTNFDLQCENLKGKEAAFDGYKKSLLCKNEYFGIEKLIIENSLMDKSDEEKFDILTCVDGEGIIEGNGYSEKIKMGDSYLMPGTLGEYQIQGRLTVLKSYSVV
jgi:mannose-6-phosphate isomerase